ncbi:hypothetical protein HMPREF1528_00447 [Capnocytophaga sp. oral taxon 336 str. F0502]|nr:hypothetical protein HMPREF1528_00447 [Capnocytophaga sp. oral taxon 336 str. F0502]
MWRVIYSVSPRTPEGGQAGKGDKPPSLHIFRSRGAHTQLLLATFKERELGTKKIMKHPPSPLQRGNVVTGKRKKPPPLHILRSRGAHT